MLSRTITEAQEMLTKVVITDKSMGLKISLPKTEIVLSNSPNLVQSIDIQQDKIQVVEESKYPWSLIDANGSSSNEVRTQMTSAAKAFAQLNSWLWQKHQIQLQIEIRIYEVFFRSVLPYECGS